MKDKTIMHLSDDHHVGVLYADFSYTTMGIVTVYNPDNRFISQYFEEEEH
jgi:hypothetical protein